jgi:hypothetical protein
MILELKEASGCVCVLEVRRCLALRGNIPAEVNTADAVVQMTSTARTRYPAFILFIEKCVSGNNFVKRKFFKRKCDLGVRNCDRLRKSCW